MSGNGKGPNVELDDDAGRGIGTSTGQARDTTHVPSRSPTPVQDNPEDPPPPYTPQRHPASARAGADRAMPRPAADIPANTTDADTNFTEDTTNVHVADTTWNTTGVCAQILSPGYTVNDMLKDINGSEGFSEDKAAIGTIPVLLHLQVTAGMSIPENYVIGRDPFVSAGVRKGSEEYQRRILLFIWANQHALIEANIGLSREHATFLAFLRFNFVLAGGVARLLTNRSIYVDEYTPSRHTYADVVLQDISITQLEVQYIATHWLQFVALLRHLFITRGHHYKTEYLEVIERTWKATTIEAPVGVSQPTWQHILRTGLHCFGIRILHLFVYHGYRAGLLAKSFDTRYNAAPAGTAPIRTGWAGVLNMQKTSWWPYFYARYKTQVDDLEVAYKRSMEIGLRGHINAKLFNWSWSRIVIDEAPVTALAPLVLAFIDTLDRSESIKGQQTLNKRADGGSAIRQAFTMVLTNHMRNASTMQTMEAYFGVPTIAESRRIE